MHKACFLDRDGVLNEDTHYTHKIEDFILLPGVIEGLQQLKKQNFLFFIVTNQSGIGRGYYSEEDMHKFNDHLRSILAVGKIKIEKIYFCPHHPDDKCNCRKPSPESAKKAEKEFDIDLSASYMLGDHKTDIDMGKNAGMKTVFLMTGHGRKEYNDTIKPDHVAEDFLDAANWITKNEKD